MTIWTRSVTTLMVSLLATTLPSPSVCAGEKPQVVQATPDNGDTGVDAELKEIRVVFDRDMMIGSHSWVGGGPAFPKLSGQPFWADKRTAVLPVTLEENHTYWLSINNATYQNFKALDGTPAEPYPISFTTGPDGAKAGARQEKLTPELNQKAIDELRTAIDRHYSYNDIKKVNWNRKFTSAKTRLLEAEKPQEFAAEAGKLLAAAEDLHIWLTVGPAQFSSHSRSVSPNTNLDTLRRVVPNWRQHSYAVCTARFEDGIRYILVGTWSSQQDDTADLVIKALTEMAQAPAIVIDVRSNSGGDEAIAQQVAGCFVDKPSVYAKSAIRAPDAPGGFLGPFDRVLEPNSVLPTYRGKVAVLMGPANMSSCEAFLLMMKQVVNCRSFGAASYGSSGNPKPHELSNGVTVYLPSWKALRPDGTCFEGEGIQPDVPISAQPVDFAQQDPVLDAALEWLRSE